MSTKRIADELSCVLGLERRIVGVKFLFSEEEYSRMDVPEVKHRLSYCNMVKTASKGGSMKASIRNFLCVGSAKALGLIKPDAHALSGELYYSFGLYDSIATAKQTQKDVTFLEQAAFGVAVMPLEEAVSDLDVVIFIANPYQGMRLIQGYACFNGAAKQIKMVSNSGICSECTATPYANKDINVSLLCSNTRFGAKWQDDELGVGMPFSLLKNVHEGVIKTIEPCETNERKRMIADRLRHAGLDLEIRMNSTYFAATRTK